MGAYNKVATEFNSNQLRIISLNDLIDDCNHYRRLAYINNPNVEALKFWRNTLKSIELDVVPKLSKEEKAGLEKKWIELKQIGKITKIKRTQEGNRKVLDLTKFHLYWEGLIDIEKILRILADSKGMLLTNKKTEESEDPDEW